MGLAPLGQIIHLPDVARAAVGIKAGDIVTISVIKSITTGIWAIGVKGIVFRARSRLELMPGEKYTATVLKSSRGFELKLADKAAPPLASSLKEAGFSQDPLTLLIISSLMKYHVKLDAADVRALRQLLERMKGDAKRNARNLGLLIAKGIRPDSPGLEELATEISWAESGGGEREHRRRRPPPRREEDERPDENPAQSLKRLVVQTSGGITGALAMSNHLTTVSGEGDWIVIPYRTTLEGKPLEGTLRFLYDHHAKKIKKTVIVATDPTGHRFQFILLPAEGGQRLSVFSSDTRFLGLKADHWPETAERFAAAGVMWDKAIGEDEWCDGFGTDEEGTPYRSIDTEG